MPPRDLIQKWKVNRGIVTYVERKPLLYGKKMSDNDLVDIKWIAIYVLLDRNFNNGE